MCKKPGMMFYFDDWKPILQLLNAEEISTLFRAVMEYGATGAVPEQCCRGGLALAWEILKKAADRDTERYEAVSGKRRQAAEKRWERKADMQTDANDANACFASQTDANASFALRNDANACFSMQTDANDANTNTNSNTNTNTNTNTNINTKNNGKPAAAAERGRAGADAFFPERAEKNMPFPACKTGGPPLTERLPDANALSKYYEEKTGGSVPEGFRDDFSQLCGRYGAGAAKSAIDLTHTSVKWNSV